MKTPHLCTRKPGIVRRSHRGFTLVELMVTLVIIGVLAAVALPSFKKHIAKGRRSDAMTALSSITQAQERLRSNRGTYASALSDPELSKLGFANNMTPKGHYQLSISGLGNPPTFHGGFTVTATASSSSAQADDTDCATLYIQISGSNLIYGATDAAGNNSSARCWPR